jgi:hypothetical protein
LVDTQSREAFSLHARQTKAGLGEQENQVDYYLQQIESVKEYLQNKVEYLVGDGFYAKHKIADKVLETGLHFISKLRSGANESGMIHMKYVYEGEHQKRKGAKKKYEGKVVWKGCFDKFTFVAKLENGISLYSKDVYSIYMKRQLRVVVLQTYNSKGKMVPAFISPLIT